MENDELTTAVADTKLLVQRLGARENRIASALDTLDNLATGLTQLGQVLLNRINTINNAGQQLNTNVQTLSTKIDNMANSVTEMETRLEAVEANVESVRQTVVALLDEAGEPEPTTTTTPPPE
jgi:chromosome segregation ATPase